MFQISNDLRRILWYSKSKSITKGHKFFDNFTEIVNRVNSQDLNIYDINLKESKICGTNQNDSKPKNIKSIDFQANTNPSITIDLNYSIPTRNSSKSPETKTPGR